ncbi:MAG: GspE/PulE family protein [Chloroflexota bacterium]|nr:GspE/PulE family protein [Chloroflexota bacterium]
MAERRPVGFQERLGQVLVEGGFITKEQLDQARQVARESGKTLINALWEKRFISREVLASALSFQFKIPVVSLRQTSIDPKALELVPEEFARQHQMIPFGFDNSGALKVAMENPQDFETINALSAMVRKTVRPHLPLEGGVQESLDSNYKLTGQITQELNRAVQDESRVMAVRAPTAEAVTAEQVAQAPVVRAVEMITLQALKSRASDIHIVPTFDSAKVLYRIDGVLQPAITIPLSIHQNMVSRIKVMANMDIAEKRRPQDGQFSLNFGERRVDFRVASVETAYGEMLVIRVLDRSGTKFNLAELGLVGSALSVYQRFLQAPLGMILTSGPTGSGKTTTLYASLHTLADGKRNIMTIEDPVEYRFENVNQIQVNPTAGVDFVAGLRAIMRLDPDIILVGEIRDKETAYVAVQAAHTGHLVLSTIHSNDSSSAVTRLLTFDIEPFLVASALLGVVAQRLIRKVCPHCRAPVELSATEALSYEQEMQESAGEFTAGQGCNMCSMSGFLGRVGVYEVLAVSEEIKALVLSGAPATEIKQEAIRQGMISLRRAAMLKAKEGITTVGEVLRNVYTID